MTDDSEGKDIRHKETDHKQKLIISFYNNENKLAECDNERTGANIVKANLTNVIRILAGLPNDRTLVFQDEKGNDITMTGGQMADKMKTMKNNTKRIYPTSEAYFDLNDTVMMTKFTVGEKVVSTAHTRSKLELEIADDLAQDFSWGEYKNKLEEILDEGITWIMELKPSTFPWKKNVRSDGMDFEDLMNMSGDQDLIEG